MAYTEVVLPENVWVELAIGPAEGLVTAGIVGDIRVREESAPPPVGEAGTPMSKKGNNFTIPVGQMLYAKCVNTDSICHLEVEE